MTTFADMGRASRLGVGAVMAAMALVGVGCGTSDPANPSPSLIYSTGDGGAADSGSTASSSSMTSSDGAAGDVGSGASFTELYTSIFAVTCAGADCHAPGTHHGISFLTRQSGYASVRAKVRPGDAANSPFYQVVEQGKMPPAGPPLSPSQLALIANWINTGALDD